MATTTPALQRTSRHSVMCAGCRLWLQPRDASAHATVCTGLRRREGARIRAERAASVPLGMAPPAPRKARRGRRGGAKRRAKQAAEPAPEPRLRDPSPAVNTHARDEPVAAATGAAESWRAVADTAALAAAAASKAAARLRSTSAGPEATQLATAAEKAAASAAASASTLRAKLRGATEQDSSAAWTPQHRVMCTSCRRYWSRQVAGAHATACAASASGPAFDPVIARPGKLGAARRAPVGPWATAAALRSAELEGAASPVA